MELWTNVNCPVCGTGGVSGVSIIPKNETQGYVSNNQNKSGTVDIGCLRTVENCPECDAMLVVDSRLTLRVTVEHVVKAPEGGK